MRALRLTSAAALTASALLLAGCGGGADDTAAGSTSAASSSPSSSSSSPSSSEQSSSAAGTTAAAPSGPSFEVPAEFGGATLPLPEGASVASAAADADGRSYLVTLTGVTGQAGYEFYREALPAAGYEVSVDTAQAMYLQAENSDGADVTYSGFLDQVELRFL